VVTTELENYGIQMHSDNKLQTALCRLSR